MTTFDERERAYEAKFAHDEELRFLATSRRNKLLARWVAEKLGLGGEEIHAYELAVLKADLIEHGDQDVINKVMGDLKAKNIPVEEAQIKQKLIEFMAEAVKQVQAERA